MLVGTVSIEKSERLSKLLKLRGIRHVVLNAKYHAQEAEIVAQAGRKGTVTIATNMAGRGTDILLGGNPEFMARQQTLAEEIAEKLPKGQEKFVDDEDFVYFYHLDSFYRVPRPDYERISTSLKNQTDLEHDEVVSMGGLHIIATERHEARRIDNQLRGRAGRQGDPGSSRFYLSLEDDLMRIFGSDRISGLMQRLGMEEGVPIEHKMVTNAIARAQKQVEAQNFSVRKHLLEYDDVMNKQRESIYSLRRELLEGKIHLTEEDSVETREYLMTLAEELIDTTVDTYAGEDVDPEERDFGAMKQAVGDIFGIDPDDLNGMDLEGHEHGGDHRCALGTDAPAVREQGIADPDRYPPSRRAGHHAPDRGRAVEGSPLQPGPPEGRHRPARLRPARSPRRVQERKLRALPGDEGPHRGRDRSILVATHAGHRRRCVGDWRPDSSDAAPTSATADDAELAAIGSATVALRRDPRQRGRRRRPGAAQARAHRRRRRRQAGEARRAEGRTQRSVPVRERQEV